jgi:hypothetical protein
VFVVSRSGDQVPVQVSFTTQDGTAKAGIDYQAESGTLTFAAGQATATVAVPVLDDGAFGGQRTFTVLLSNPVVTAPFATVQTFAAGTQPFAVAVADVNGDGKPDLAVANYHDGTVSVLLNTTPQGATVPTFATGQTFAVGADPHSVAVGDFNGDDKPDLAVANTKDGTVSVLLNTTPQGATIPTFAGQQTFAVGHGPQAVAVGDFNGDGKPDLVVANFNDNTVSVLLNTTPQGASVPSFATGKTFAAGAQPDSVAVGEVNGDGKPDLAVANYLDGTVSVLLNTTPKGATSPSFATQQTFAAGTDPESVAVDDFNGDGKPDLAVADYGGTVSVLLNTTPKGATIPTFATRQTFAAGSGASAVAVGDFNGDSKPDLAVANQLDDTLGVLPNTAPQGATIPTFAGQQAFAVGHLPLAVAVGDFNGDTNPDLAVANEGGNTVSVLLNTPATITLARGQAVGTLLPAPPPPPPASTPAATQTSTVLTVPSPVPLAGQPLTLTVQVSSAAGPGTGPVVLLDVFHGVLQMVGVGALGPGATTALTVRLAAGRHLVFAFYLGDALHAPSFSAPKSFLVRRQPATPSVRQSGRVLLNLAAMVWGLAGPATGQVIFLDVTSRAHDLGAAPLDGTGFARISVSVGTGRHLLRARYSGDGAHGDGLSEALSLQVEDLAGPGAVPLLVIGGNL